MSQLSWTVLVVFLAALGAHYLKRGWETQRRRNEAMEEWIKEAQSLTRVVEQYLSDIKGATTGAGSIGLSERAQQDVLEALAAGEQRSPD